jgi:DNA modification methylase
LNLINANSLQIPLADQCVQMVVTSPPYWALRDYGVEGQLGLEATPEEFVGKMVEVFREVWRVLRDDGTLWLNLGDSYSGGGRGGNGDEITGRAKNASQCSHFIAGKPKDLCGIPWRVAFALQADGWYLRSDIIWAKPNPMPESVTDRPTKAHEYLFLLSKQARYYYDQEAVREAFRTTDEHRATVDWVQGWASEGDHTAVAHSIPKSHKGSKFTSGKTAKENTGQGLRKDSPGGRNLRTVWNIATAPYSGAHFATYPPALVEPCIKAGTSERGCCPKCGAGWARVVEKGSASHDAETDSMYQDGAAANRLALLRQAARKNGGEYANQSTTTGWQPGCDCNAGDPVPCLVLDPFAGSGTTLLVARKLGRRAVGLDLSFAYLSEQARSRLSLDALEAWETGGLDGSKGSDLGDLPMFAGSK